MKVAIIVKFQHLT